MPLTASDDAMAGDRVLPRAESRLRRLRLGDPLRSEAGALSSAGPRSSRHGRASRADSGRSRRPRSSPGCGDKCPVDTDVLLMPYPLAVVVDDLRHHTRCRRVRVPVTTWPSQLHVHQAIHRQAPQLAVARPGSHPRRKGCTGYEELMHPTRHPRRNVRRLDERRLRFEANGPSDEVMRDDDVRCVLLRQRAEQRREVRWTNSW